jgi:hypothetical protein
MEEGKEGKRTVSPFPHFSFPTRYAFRHRNGLEILTKRTEHGTIVEDQ